MQASFDLDEARRIVRAALCGHSAVDIVDLSKVSPQFRDRMLKERVRWSG